MRVTAIVPAIPTRMGGIVGPSGYLGRALFSVAAQTRPPDEILCRVANDKMWLGDQRNHMLAQATGDFIATLDDDDEWYTHHLEKLIAEQERTDADMVFSWFDVKGGTDPFPECAEREWSNDEPFATTSVVLVRTEVARAVGGWGRWREDEGVPMPVARLEGEDIVLWEAECGNVAGEDVLFVSRLIKADAKIVHLCERTWRWHHHFGEQPHTMGLPSRWS